MFNRGDTPDIVMRNSVIGGEGYANMTGHFLLGGAEAILTGPHVDKEDKRTKVALADLYLAIAEGSLGNNLKLQQMIKAAALLLEVGGEFKEVYENVVGRMGHLINDNNHST